MNKAYLLTVLFASKLAFSQSSYDTQLKILWNKACEKRQEHVQAYLPKNLKEFLTEKAGELDAGERIVLAFYPTMCGFDTIAEETDCFTDLQMFYPLVYELGFKIIFCAPERHFAEFADTQELNAYLEKTFETHLRSEETPLRIPTKVIFAELEKQDSL